MRYNLKLAEAFHKTDIGLDGILVALGKEPPIPPPPPSNPKTVVTYQGGMVEEYLIEGELGENSIPNTYEVTKVEIGNTVTSIGYAAFSNGSYPFLSSVIIGNNVILIEESAFQNCLGLKFVDIGNNVKNIGHGVFNFCKGLSLIICRAKIAPIVQDTTFGTYQGNYTGRNTYSIGNNVLKVPQDATGYETVGMEWKDTLLDSTKCGFHIEYI